MSAEGHQKINRQAVCHIPLSNYAFASSTSRMTIRLRCAKGNLLSCLLYYGDRAYNGSPVKFCCLDMKVAASDELFDYYEADFESPYPRVCYYFQLICEEEWSYYYADRFCDYLPDLTVEEKLVEGRSEYYQYPFILREEIADTPEWFKNAAVYNIFPDSFASDRRKISGKPKEVLLENGRKSTQSKGGNLHGILKNLDYIQEMGFDCIYLNPVFVAGEWHKYDIMDYFHIDPCMGSNEEFKGLVEEIHARGMKMIIDGVFNHCSWYFSKFEDVVQKGEDSLYKDWFYELHYPVKRPCEGELPEYMCFAYEPKMPKLNTSNPEVQKYFAEVCRYWIEQYDIDGWRLDVANEIDRNFWRLFRKTAVEAKREIVLIGEVWENAETWLRGDAFHSTMNYDFRKHCRDFFALDRCDAKGFGDRVTDMLLRYPRNVANSQLNLLDSHDVPRFLSLCGGNMEKWKLAYLCLMLMPGVPSLFYGDEMGALGIAEREYRRPMPWEQMEEMKELRLFVAEAAAIRRKYVDGDAGFRIVEAQSESGLFAFERKGRKGSIQVFLNNGAERELPETKYKKELLGCRVEGGKIGAYGCAVYAV